MTTAVVDANIVFSALISAGNKSGSVLMAPPESVKFVSCHFLSIELFRYSVRIGQFSGLNDDDLIDLLYEISSHIEFINEAYIPFSCWQQATKFLKFIDPEDTPYLALAIHLDAPLWTGDKRLLDGLRSLGYDRFITTDQLLELA